MEPGRETAVIFAGLVGAAELYARAGEAAPEAIGRSLERLAQAAESCGARAVKRIGGRLMVLAASADAAARAAAAMHAAAADFPAAGSTRLALGVAFHYGPVTQAGAEVLGTTVNIAARLVERASGGQTLLAAQTATALSPPYRGSMRHLAPTPLRALSEEVELCELLWRADEGASSSRPEAAARPRARLRLEYAGRQLLLRRSLEALTIGRDSRCGLVVADRYASRRHCLIERRVDDFVLIDKSTNGSFVTVAGEGELLVEHEEFTLRRHGWICLGNPRSAAASAVEFFCE
jgi:adenylate cyclase